ncbi:MAG: response regulator [Desulfobacteraceae bacterium]|nr:response regulator [Desulfobacteraceae bacterium]
MKIKYKFLIITITLILLPMLFSTITVSFVVGRQNDSESWIRIDAAIQHVLDDIEDQKQNLLDELKSFILRKEIIESAKFIVQNQTEFYLSDILKEVGQKLLAETKKVAEVVGYHSISIYDHKLKLLTSHTSDNQGTRCSIYQFNISGKPVHLYKKYTPDEMPKAEIWQEERIQNWPQVSDMESEPAVRVVADGDLIYFELTGPIRVYDLTSKKIVLLGYVVVHKYIDNSYAQVLSKNTQTAINFFSSNKMIAGALHEFNQLSDSVFNQLAENKTLHREIALDALYYTGLYSIFDPYGKAIGTIAASLSKEKTIQKTKEAIFYLIVIAMVCVLLMIPVVFLLSNMFVRPIHELMKGTKKIGSGDLDYRISIASNDEIGLLAETFNQMVKTIKLGVKEKEKAQQDVLDSQQVAIQNLNKFRQIFENAVEGMFQMSRDGHFLRANSAMATINGYDSPEEMMSSITDVRKQHYYDPNDRREFSRILQETGRVEGFEARLLRKDGSVFWASISARVVKDAETGMVYYEGSLVDMTEKKEKENEERKRKVAEAANNAKTEFLSNMSHEIRTPLNGIIGMTELALDDNNLDDKQKNIFYTINTETSSLQDVINEVLDFSKIEAGKLELEQIPFDLKHSIEDVVNIFAYRAEQKGLMFISFLAPDVPVKLIGDPGRFRQIIVNLAGNALKFTQEGEIYIKGELFEDLGDKIKIRISIKDTGIGIPKDKQAAIFDSFTQVDGSTTRKYGGTGLGTTISKQLTEAMGGEIGIESEEGRGSTFWFTAVFCKQKEQKPILKEKELDLRNLKVLVVDHNKTNRFVLTEYLRAWDCFTVEAMDGKEALSILKGSNSSKEPFSLILIDFQISKINCFDLARKIKTVETLQKIPIIVLSSTGMKGDGKSCREIGVNGYLTKPIRQDDLHRVILSVLGLSKETQPHTSPKLVTRHTIAEDYSKEGHILLTEDYPTNQQVAMRHLQKAGYQVDLAENGQLAVEAYKNKSYDLILMDIQMPLMDGYEATAKILELETQSLNHVPIIAMTAHAIQGYREKCLEAGMDDYITKPLRRKGLLAMVDKWIGTIKNREKGTGTLQSERLINSQSSIVSTQSKEDTPIDFEKAIDEFEGDKQFLLEVVEGFLDNVRIQIPTIRQAISDGDAEVVRRESHSIKGGAANLVAKELSKVAFELENIGISGELEESIEVLEKLKKEFNRLEVYTGEYC